MLLQPTTEDSIQPASIRGPFSGVLRTSSRRPRGTRAAGTCPDLPSSSLSQQPFSQRARRHQLRAHSLVGCDDITIGSPLDSYYYSHWIYTRPPVDIIISLLQLRVCPDLYARARTRARFHSALQVVSSSLRGPVYACVLHMCVNCRVSGNLLVCVCVCLSKCVSE